MQCLFYHKWCKWFTERRDHIEAPEGWYIPYIVQRRICDKCGKNEIDVTYGRYIKL